MPGAVLPRICSYVLQGADAKSPRLFEKVTIEVLTAGRMPSKIYLCERRNATSYGAVIVIISLATGGSSDAHSLGA